MTAALIPAPRADLCLDYVNTLYWRGSDPPTETLKSPQDLLAWCGGRGTLDAAALAEAIELRETVHRLFSAAANAREPAVADLQRLNRVLAQAPARNRLQRTGKDYHWRNDDASTAVAVLLAPVLWSAGDLLASGQAARVRQCENPKCRWLFLDASKTGARRWCSMQSCGNRAKAQRHYVRTRQADARPATGSRKRRRAG